MYQRPLEIRVRASRSLFVEKVEEKLFTLKKPRKEKEEASLAITINPNNGWRKVDGAFYYVHFIFSFLSTLTSII